MLVFQTDEVGLEEMRGTSVAHGPLPVIVLNNTDAPHGRLFTLLHEFIHILLANSDHATSPMEGKQLPKDRILERVSNRVPPRRDVSTRHQRSRRNIEISPKRLEVIPSFCPLTGDSV